MPDAIAGREDRAHLARFNLIIDGSQAPKNVMEDLLDCTVENSIHLPDFSTIRLYDAHFHWLDADTFREGVKVEILGGDETASLTTLFHGEVTSLEMDLSAHGIPTLLIRCMSRAHRLHRGRYARSFVQMKDSDIAQKIGQEAGFDVKADATSQVHDWVFQNNQTNWEFLSDRAARNGYRLFVSGESELHFGKVADSVSDSATVVWGGNLRSFRPRISAAPQVDEVLVRGWDPLTKSTILGKSQTVSGVPNVNGRQVDGGKAASAAFGSARMVVVDRPIQSQTEADALAKSVYDDIGGEFLEAEGLCYGEPKLRPNTMVQIGNIGTRFSGKYFVTAATHTYTPSEGYTTQFTVSGKTPRTILSMLGEDGRGSSDGYRARSGNIVVGIVTDNKDPKELGRVKVKYPWLSEEHTSFWARIAVPMAGPDRGFFFLPEIDDEVLVAFEHGDIHRPYLLGALWNGKDKPVEANSKAVADGLVQRRTIKTRIGHTVLFDDTDGKGEMSLTTKAVNRIALDDKNQNIFATTTKGHTLILDDKNKQVQCQTTSGHSILLDDQNSKIVVVDKTGSNKITIQSTDNSMKLECNGNFTVDAKGKVSIQGQQGIEIKTPMQVQMQGSAGVDVKSSAMVNIEGTGPTTVKSSAILTIQGSLVKIN